MNTILLLILKCKLPAEGDYTGRNEHPSHPLRTSIFLQVLTGHWKRTQGPYAPGRRTAGKRVQIAYLQGWHHLSYLNIKRQLSELKNTFDNLYFIISFTVGTEPSGAGGWQMLLLLCTDGIVCFRVISCYLLVVSLLRFGKVRRPDSIYW